MGAPILYPNPSPAVSYTRGTTCYYVIMKFELSTKKYVCFVNEVGSDKNFLSRDTNS